MSKESVIEHLTEENNRLREELERVKAERDAAINDVMSWAKPFFPCSTCAEFIKASNTCKIPDGMPCRYKWRGLQEAALKEGKG